MVSPNVQAEPGVPGAPAKATPVKATSLLVSALWTLALAIPLVARSGRIPFGLALGALTTTGLVALGLTVTAGYRRLAQGERIESATLAAAPLALLFLGLAGLSLARFPWVHDVAAAAEVPRFQWLAPTEPPGATIYDERAQRLLQERYPNLKPSQLSQRPARVFAHALVSASRLPHWRLERMSQKERRFEGTMRSSLGFDSQLVVVVRPEGRGSAVDVRARSLGAIGDFGENARIIQRYFDQLGQSWMCKPPADFAAKRPR